MDLVKTFCFHESTAEAHRRIRHCRFMNLIILPRRSPTGYENTENGNVAKVNMKTGRLAFQTVRCIFELVYKLYGVNGSKASIIDITGHSKETIHIRDGIYLFKQT